MFNENESHKSSDKKKVKKKGLLHRIIFRKDSNRSCVDLIIIPFDSPIYQAWKMLVIIFCIMSSYIYAYIAAFGIPRRGDSLSQINIISEVIFAIDVVV